MLKLRERIRKIEDKYQQPNIYFNTQLFDLYHTVFLIRIEEPEGLKNSQETYELLKKDMGISMSFSKYEFEEKIDFLKDRENHNRIIKSFENRTDEYNLKERGLDLENWIEFFRLALKYVFKRSHLTDKYGNEKLRYLREIDVKDNEIDWIQLQTFDGLWRLRELTISDTQITQINGKLFESISNLKELWLHNNRIKQINSDSFKGLENLTSLSLENNQIFEIKDEAFDGLSNLKQLFLNRNKLSTISSSIFKSLTKLEGLWLNDNWLYTIDVNSFKTLENLKVLFLGNNELKRIDPKCFVALESIEVIELYDNTYKFDSFLNPSTKYHFNREKLDENGFISNWNKFLGHL